MTIRFRDLVRLTSAGIRSIGTGKSACHLSGFFVLLLIASAACADNLLPVTDDFANDSTIAPVWQPFAANGGSVILGPTSTGGSLSLYVPGGTADHSVNIPNQSTRIMQHIGNVDLGVEMLFTSMVLQPFQGQGLIVQQDDSNFIRFGISTDGCQAYIYGASIENGVPFTFFDEPVKNGANLYLRMARSGSDWYFDYSYDHDAWVFDATRTGQYMHPEDGRPSLTLNQNLNVSSIGLYAENSPVDGSSYAFTATVGYFLNSLQPPAFFRGVPYPPPAAPPQINLWYGNNQTFGATGVPQQWVNILGNVTSPVGIATLTYSLNGAPEVSLSFGETSDRLVDPGDFNADIDYSLLRPGSNNQVVITATDYRNQTAQQTVTINNVGTQLASNVGNFTVDFQKATNATLQNWVQIVDGKWEIGPDNRIRNTQRGYDRAILVGDQNISGSYDVRTEFVLHEYSCAGGVFGLASGWQGHTKDDYGYPYPYQPFIGHPFPAFAVFSPDWYDIQQNLPPLYNTTLARNDTAPSPTPETPYMFHYRVTPNADGITNHSSFNIWPKGTAEPAQWTVEADTPARSGSILFDAHELDISIGPTISFTRSAVQVGLDQTLVSPGPSRN